MANKFMVCAVAIVAVLLVTVRTEDSPVSATNTSDPQSQTSSDNFITSLPFLGQQGGLLMSDSSSGQSPGVADGSATTTAPVATATTTPTITSTTTTAPAAKVAINERDVPSKDCSSQLKIFFANHPVPERAIAEANLTVENYCKELNDSLSHFKDACSQNTVEPDDSHIFASLSNGTEFLCGNGSRNMAEFFVNGTACSNSISTSFKSCTDNTGNFTFPVEMILTGTRTDCDNLARVISCVGEALAGPTSCSAAQGKLMRQIMNTVLPKNCGSTPSTTVDPGTSTEPVTAATSEGGEGEPSEPSEEPTEPTEDPSQSTTAEPENPASGSKSLEFNLFVMLCVLVVTYWMH